MKEKLKSLALALLIVFSLVQSYYLIYQLPGSDSVITSETNYVKTENMGQEQAVEQFIFPDQMVVHLGEDRHTVFYPRTTFYNLIYSRLEGRSFENFQRRTVQSADWNVIRMKNAGFELSFPGGIPVPLLQRVMKLSSDPVFEGESINRIWIYIDDNGKKVHALFFSARGDVVYEASKADLTAQDVQQHVDFGQNWTPYTTADGKVYLPKENMSMVQTLIPIGVFSTEQMQRSLFFDPSITRNIQEKDGSEIYTDSKHSLQIRQEQRWMSYADPAVPTSGNSTPAEDVLAAVDFVNQHGGWDGSYRLMLQDGIGHMTDVLFQQYYNAYPILDTATFRYGTMRMQVQQETVSLYERSLLYKKEGSGTKSAVELPGGAKLVNRLHIAAGKQEITGIAPYYHAELKDDGLQLTPVWRVQLGNGGVVTIGPEEK
ncbi:two-component system activity regulator YycH [Paenibacillus sp. JX-17]|uniref:Two-component system activity regulator YycH n=1 Tax=Paenibacillus lacisoli TaxID=3064525 RepID=A0ABT9CAA6_9BACL|nr:two-component system activity regulator YycH [Paenibacillus sp. JX-17]MDO7906195.1 two-component system activity regulator YycH [Paenibacillus sp. JX-17]